MRRRSISVAVCTAAIGLFAAANASASIVYQKGTKIYAADNAGKHAKKLGKGSYPSIAPDGKRLLFVRKNQVYLMRLPGKQTVKLDLHQRGIAARVSWSPDGSKVVTVNADSKPVLVPLDGSKTTSFSTYETTGASFSPDGSEIAFGQEVSDSSSPVAIYTLATGATRSFPGLYAAPLWTAAGIAATTLDPTGAVISLVVLGPDGSTTRTLISKQVSDGLFPGALSTDADRLVVVVAHILEDSGNIAVYDVTTGNLLSQKLIRASGTAAAISRDGSRFYIVSKRGRLAVINVKTGKKRSLIKRGVKSISST
jgi:Tol biopolymer transport system component